MASGKKRGNIPLTEALRERISDFLDIPAENTVKTSKIVIVGDSEAVVGGCGSVLEYESERIVLKTSLGKAEINGNDLTILSLLGDQITVRGRIHSVTLHSGNKENRGMTE